MAHTEALRHHRRYRNLYTYLIPISCIPIVVGSLIIWLASWEHRGVPLFGYYLLPCFGAPYVLVLASAAINTAGSTKKAITSGVIFIGYNIGNIGAPYSVLTPERPIKYRTTWITLIACMAATMVLSFVLRFVLARENKRRDALEDARSSSKSHGGASVGDSKEDINDLRDKSQDLDLTDRENRGFRYIL